MEIRTSEIPKEMLQVELEFVTGFFYSYSKKNTCVMLGINCNIPGDEMYQEIQVKTDELKNFIDKQIAEDIFHLGDDDLIIYDKDLDAEFTFCHEHDIHFKSIDNNYAKLITSRWTQMGYKYYGIDNK